METNEIELEEWEKELTIIAKRAAPRILARIRGGRRPDIVDRLLLRIAQGGVGKRRAKMSASSGSQSTLKQ